MEFYERNPKLVVWGCVTFIVIVLSIAIVIWSAGTVEPIEYAIVYNSLSKAIDMNNVYDGGWYLIGPFNTFITFSAIAVNLDYSKLPNSKSLPTDARAKGGMSIKL